MSTEKIFIIFMLGLILTAGGCSEESVKRTTYETLQNVREQDCSRTPSVDCEKRERYETYEQKRLNKDSDE